MTDSIERLAQFLDPWLGRHAAARALARLDARLAQQLRRASPAWQMRAARCLVLAAPAVAAVPDLAPRCMAWCRETLPRRDSEPAVLPAGTVSKRGTVSIRDSSRHATMPQLRGLVDDEARPRRKGPRPAPPAVKDAAPTHGRRASAAQDLLRWFADVETDAAMAASDVARWPERPRLAVCPADICPQLAHLLRLGPLPPVAEAWLEWILLRIETRGWRAGWDKRTRTMHFGPTATLQLCIVAWQSARDLRFLNALLRLGDRMLQRPHRLRDVEGRAALLAALVVREAALVQLQSETP